MLKNPEAVIARRPKADEAIQNRAEFRHCPGSPRRLRRLAMTMMGVFPQPVRAKSFHIESPHMEPSCPGSSHGLWRWMTRSPQETFSRGEKVASVASRMRGGRADDGGGRQRAPKTAAPCGVAASPHPPEALPRATSPPGEVFQGSRARTFGGEPDSRGTRPAMTATWIASRGTCSNGATFASYPPSHVSAGKCRIERGHIGSRATEASWPSERATTTS